MNTPICISPIMLVLVMIVGALATAATRTTIEWLRSMFDPFGDEPIVTVSADELNALDVAIARAEQAAEGVAAISGPGQLELAAEHARRGEVLSKLRRRLRGLIVERRIEVWAWQIDGDTNLAEPWIAEQRGLNPPPRNAVAAALVVPT